MFGKNPVFFPAEKSVIFLCRKITYFSVWKNRGFLYWPSGTGQWTLDGTARDAGQWTVDSGQWTVDSGQWTTGQLGTARDSSGQLGTADKWTLDKWTLDKWTVDGTEWTELLSLL